MHIHQAAATGFARASDAYERARPGFPDGAVAHLASVLDLRPGRDVLELGAGTGKLSRQIAPLGVRLLVLEPVEEMLARLREVVPDAVRVGGVAEAVELPDGSVDAVLAAQAFHWFDAPAAVRELHRVLREGGGVGLVWNRRDESVPWVAKLTELLAPHRGDAPSYAQGAWRPAFDETPLLTPLEHRAFRYGHVLGVEGVCDRVASISFVAALPDDARAALLDEVRALLAADETTRGRDQIELPYVTDVYTCRRRTPKQLE